MATTRRSPTASDELARRLARVPLFAPLERATLRALCRRGFRRRLAAGETLWCEGDRPDAVALVLRGRIDVVRLGAEGERLLLNVLGPDELVGLSTIAEAAHSADIVAARAAEVLIIAGAALREMFAGSPELALRSLAHMATILRHATDELESQRTADLEQRVRRLLLRHGRGRREVRFTHEELAQQAGGTRANVSRVLKRLERQGALRCFRGRIEIVDL